MVWKYCEACGDTTDGHLNAEWDYCPFCGEELKPCKHEDVETNVCDDYIEQQCNYCGATRESNVSFTEWELP